MQNNNIIKLLGLKDVKIKNMQVKEEEVIIDIELKKAKIEICPNCGSIHMHYHDKRTQEIKDIPIFGKKLILKLTRYRYKCYNCKKKTEKQPEFIQKKNQMTNRLKLEIITKYNDVNKVKQIAKELNISIATIQREIDKIYIQAKKLPEVLCIDEFKGDSGKEKYQVSIGDGENKQIIDILESRKLEELSKYFSKIPKEEREKVKYFVSDMSTTFKSVWQIYFPNSKYITDRYHYIRQITWALENVRKEEQKTMTKQERIYFKRSRSLLHKSRHKLTQEEKIKVSVMIEKNERIRKAYKLKEEFYDKVLKEKDKEVARKEYDKWIKEAKESKEDKFKSCITAFENWRQSILNSLEVRYSNGYLEGIHNRIKSIKRAAFTMKNFHRFRAKILLTLK